MLESDHANHKDVSIRFLSTLFIFSLVAGYMIWQRGLPPVFSSFFMFANLFWIGMVSLLAFSLIVEVFEIKAVEQQLTFRQILVMQTSWPFVVFHILFTVFFTFSVYWVAN